MDGRVYFYFYFIFGDMPEFSAGDPARTLAGVAGFYASKGALGVVSAARSSALAVSR
jgi:hypothetical protein